MNQQEALVKLAQVRMAINHVLRTRAMQKQASGFSARRAPWYYHLFAPDIAREINQTDDLTGRTLARRGIIRGAYEHDPYAAFELKHPDLSDPASTEEWLNQDPATSSRIRAHWGVPEGQSWNVTNGPLK